ncbi:endonuclease [Vibrio phage K389]|nr:hypothetical protein SIPHO010v1_p0055 [Vibrio phage 268E42.1]
MSRRLTTKEFIEKARIVHGARYEYERANYASAQEKVTITCQEHGDFAQTPNNHLSGKGCRKCGGSNPLTTEGFIRKALVVHGGKYEYSLTEYSSGNSMVDILCPTHGQYTVKASHHLQGVGCSSCSKKKRRTIADYIFEAKKIHGGTYSYDSTEYTNNKTDVIITCPHHGDFTQNPRVHLKGAGCPVCRVTPKFSNAEFVSKAKEVHGGEYDYSVTDYRGWKHKVTIMCKVHGIFDQDPNCHLRGQKCPRCAGNSPMSNEEFVIKAREVHGTTYSYHSHNLRKSPTHVNITCKTHGTFTQKIQVHLRGSGCPKCAKTGFKTEEIGYIYILRASKVRDLFKVGISNTPLKRIRTLIRNTPFTFTAEAVFKMKGCSAVLLERKIHSFLNQININAGFEGFDGCTEWFEYNQDAFDITTQEIRRFVGQQKME